MRLLAQINKASKQLPWVMELSNSEKKIYVPLAMGNK
jgi:hypothetical protein